LMIRRDQDNERLALNPHQLQPPFHDTTVRGDVLLMKVAADEEDEGTTSSTATADATSSTSNEDFFLNYTKEEYAKFAARTDVRAVSPVAATDDEEEEMVEDEEESDDDEEIEGEDDSEDEDDGEGGLMELLMGQVLQRFQQENGRMPDEQELQALETAIAQKLGGMVGQE